MNAIQQQYHSITAFMTTASRTLEGDAISCEDIEWREAGWLREGEGGEL